MVSSNMGNPIVGVSITDISGKSIMTEDYDAEKDQSFVNTSGLSPGIYLVHIRTKGASATKRLVVQ